MLVRLICLAFLGLFATSVAYAQEDDTQLKGRLEAMKMGADSEIQAPDDIDNNDTDTDKDNATQTLSATTSESASASAPASAPASASESPVLESLLDSAASPATKPDPE